MMRKLCYQCVLLLVGFLICFGDDDVRAANKRICVSEKLQEPETDHQDKQETKENKTEALKMMKLSDNNLEEPISSRYRSGAQVGEERHFGLPIGQTPIVYLKRLFEHFVTHQPGYEAVSDQCGELIYVELYPLERGWTVFARYSANGREERVDQLWPTELSRFAERSVLALLGDVSISNTINRDNVLRADSKKSVQRIKGTNHFMLGLGTQLRGGHFRTAATDNTTKNALRLFSPMTLSGGYRGKFENWAIEAVGYLGIGTSKTAPSRNPSGGHIDLGGDVGLALHFIRYFNPRGLTSFYMGAGASFELLWFSAIHKQGDDMYYGDRRSKLYGGGLNVDLLFGWEFMRASSIQFFLQGELNLPAYMLDNADYFGAIHTYFPALSVKLGVAF